MSAATTRRHWPGLHGPAGCGSKCGAGIFASSSFYALKIPAACHRMAAQSALGRRKINSFDLGRRLCCRGHRAHDLGPEGIPLRRTDRHAGWHPGCHSQRVLRVTENNLLSPRLPPRKSPCVEIITPALQPDRGSTLTAYRVTRWTTAGAWRFTASSIGTTECVDTLACSAS